MASPMTNRSRLSISDLAQQGDSEFKSHPKFQKKSSPFASGTLRFKSRPSDTPGPNAYAPAQPGSARGATLALSSRRTGVRRPATDAVYDTSVEPGASVRREARSGSSAFVSRTGRAVPAIRDGVDPTRYSPNIAPTVPSARNLATAAFKSRSQRGVRRPPDGPSPTSYSAVDPSRPSRAVSSSFASRSPRLGGGRASTPGPGQHYAPTPFGGGRGAAAAFKSQTVRMKYRHPDGPAPGAYEPTPVGSSRSYSIGKAPRKGARGADTPGPGCYESVQRTDRRAPVLRTSSPRVLSVRSSTPGPGAYFGGGSSGTFPSATAAFRSSSSGAARGGWAGTPGPGAHLADGYSSLNLGKGPSMKGSERFRQRPDPSPGPGHFVKSYSSFLE